MGDKKQLEMRCFSVTRKYLKEHFSKKERLYAYSLFPFDLPVSQSERPDFLVNTDAVSYLLEHFI